MEFNKEEISLCKQVAEKYKKPLENFDLIIGTYLSGKEFIGYFHEDLAKEKFPKTRLDEIMVGLSETAKSTSRLIPLWTISDCLEFLSEKYGSNIDLHRNDKVLGGQWLCKIAGKVWSGKTPLETCLKPVLAMFEDK